MPAYADGDLRRGDRLYASAKGFSVETLLDNYLGPDRPKEREVPRLIIDIRAELPAQNFRPWHLLPPVG